jgi:RND family efflux transporter MFP subunit
MNEKPKLEFSKTFLRRVYIALLVMLGIAIIGIAMRLIEYQLLRAATQQQAILSVATIKANNGPLTQEIILPGNVLAWHEATIYARTNGYVAKWLVDIGSRVKTGDLLAQIASPEVDAQLRQTEAELKTAEANDKLAQSTAIRWKNLLKTESVSKQETDEKVSDAKAKAAIVASTRAARDRLRDLVSFERVTAPFDGVIMSRNTDIGRLINAGSGTVPLFRLVQSNRLRLYVRVPEYFSPSIKKNTVAQMYFTEKPGKIFSAKLLDTADAIDVNTRTLLVQFEIDNPNNEIFPGSYTQVHLKLPVSHASLYLPANTLIFRSQGLQVATVDKGNKTMLKSVTAGRDFGNTIEIVAGLEPGETIIINPPDSLVSGEKVNVVSTETATDGNLS